MKILQRLLVCVLTLSIFTACSAVGDSSSSSEPDNVQNVGTQSEDPAEMAVLNIETENGKNDFATKPVDSFVANSIASWTPGYVVPPAPYYEDCTITLKDNETTLVDSASAQVKVRGNWTTSYDKKPFRIKFKEKQSMLGLNGGEALKNWVLLAEYKDGSMLRNKTALSISREILEKDGLYASDAEFVEVYINGEYWGVYLLAEYQQANSRRVDITVPEKDYKGTDIGYFLEFDGNYLNEDSLHGFSVDYADNAPLIPFDGNDENDNPKTCPPKGTYGAETEIGITIKSDIYSPEQHDFIAAYINNAYRVMYSAAYEDKAYVFSPDYSGITETSEISPREAVERVVDTQSLADMYIISELTCDADIYWSSFFMDVDFGEGGSGKLTFEAPWDFDSAMGNKDRCADGKGFYAANIIPDVNANEFNKINPWLAVLMNEDWFREIVREKWTAAYDSGVFERASQLMESDRTRYSDAFERNYDRWNNLADNSAFRGELSSGAAACKTHEDAVSYLSDWLNNRVQFLNDYWHA